LRWGKQSRVLTRSVIVFAVFALALGRDHGRAGIDHEVDQAAIDALTVSDAAPPRLLARARPQGGGRRDASGS
jgi:hypothetical protein